MARAGVRVFGVGSALFMMSAMLTACWITPPPPAVVVADSPPQRPDEGATSQVAAGSDGQRQERAPQQVAGGSSGNDGAAGADRGGAALAASDLGPSGCGVRPPAVRRGGNLTVESPPRARQRSIGSRMRADTEGSLTVAAPRAWVGIEVPSFVQISSGTLELFLLDKVRVDPDSPPGAPPDGFLAFYRDPYDASSCGLSGKDGSANCAYGVALYECSGKIRWVFALEPFLSRPDHLEVQDVRYAGGVLYFNEACQSYSREAGGRCSSLVAVDPVARKVLWRSQPLVSNNQFVVVGRYLVTGYGFTAEPDFLYVLRRSDGKVMQRVSVATAHETMTWRPDGTLAVKLYDESVLGFALQGFDGDTPKLVKVAAGVGSLETRR